MHAEERPVRVQSHSSFTLALLNETIARTQHYLLSIQFPEGYWYAQLECNVTITAETVLLYKILGVDKSRPMKKLETYLRSQQRGHGGWEMFYGDGGDVSTTVEVYMALRLLDVPTSDPALQKAREHILKRGGITQTRMFTKFFLALIGCYDWCGVPSLPPWIIMFPDSFPLNIYELSSWARSTTVPLLIVFDRKPVFTTEPVISLDELYAEGRKHARFGLPLHGDWTDLFVMVDSVFKLLEKFNLIPFRQRSLKAVESWLVEHQEESGDWGGIFPAMFNSLLALNCLGYSISDPIMDRGLQALHHFSLETEDECCIQASVSPIWDTALVMRALLDSGIRPNHPALQRSGEWLLQKQILTYGDWKVKNKEGKPGAWSFEFCNRFYPDVDDTAIVVMALLAVELPNEPLKQAAICRAVNWIASMQSRSGGWAAFDVNNDQAWLNAIPYGDLKAMIDPSTADVTARVLEMAGRLKNCPCPNDSMIGTLLPRHLIDRALVYLTKEQEAEGCWYGRWGVNYIYGTSGALAALSVIAPKAYSNEIERGAKWLVKAQNESGGWGESCFSYVDPSLKGQGETTASQTSWAIIGLLAAGDALGRYEIGAIQRGIKYLLDTQLANGSWNEACFTGTGFPGHLYLKYHLYANHFPLTALGRYRSALAHGNLSLL